MLRSTTVITASSPLRPGLTGAPRCASRRTCARPGLRHGRPRRPAALAAGRRRRVSRPGDDPARRRQVPLFPVLLRRPTPGRWPPPGATTRSSRTPSCTGYPSPSGWPPRRPPRSSPGPVRRRVRRVRQRRHDHPGPSGPSSRGRSATGRAALVLPDDRRIRDRRPERRTGGSFGLALRPPDRARRRRGA